MKTTESILLFILAFTLTLNFSCKKDEANPELTAKTGPDTTASIGDTVWLDASASTGADDYGIEWTIQNQPGDDTITNSSTDSAYFIPRHNGIYQVQLTITKESFFNSDYQDILVTGSTALPDEISTSTRLRKIAVGGDIDYIALGEVIVTANLIVDPGVIIEFNKDASLHIMEEGKIYAENASFIPAESDWKGICIKSKGNTFTNCLIANAGNASFTDNPVEKSAVIMLGNSSIAFSGNTLNSSNGYGIILKDNSDFFFDSDNQVHAFENNRFISNATGPMVIPVYVLNDFSSQFFEQETEGSYIEIYGSSYSSSESTNPLLISQGMAYKITGLIEFNKELAINNGVEMYFEDDAGIKVNGHLLVSGTPEDPVLMDGLSSSTASWMGIHVQNGQVELRNFSLLNAGNALFTGLTEKASLIAEDLLSMSNTIISGSGGIGLYMPGNAHILYADNFIGNSFQNNGTSAVRIRMDDVNKVVSGNTFSTPSADVPAIEVHMGLDDPLGTWTNTDAVYDYKILESLTIKATKDLVIEAGATLKMTAGSTLQVSGGLEARGSSGSEITIEGAESKKGHWDGIFLNGSQAIDLDFLLIRDGGGGLNDKADVIVEATVTDVSISNSIITNSKGYGVLVKSGASDFGINEPASNNTLEGDQGGFHQETK